MSIEDHPGRLAGLSLVAVLAPLAFVAYAALVPRFYLGGETGWTATLIASPLWFAVGIVLGFRTRNAGRRLSRTVAWISIAVGAAGVLTCLAGWWLTFWALSHMDLS
jgi:hypothetical protein